MAPPTKPKAPPAHPTYKVMIAAAIVTLKERSGSSRQAIIKHIKANYKVGDNVEVMVRNQLPKLVKSNVLIQTKGKGASGSFKVVKVAAPKPKKAASPKKKKSVVKKEGKKKSPAKKSAQKKSVGEKKKSASTKAKKPSSPKKKKSSPKKKTAAAKKKPVAKKAPAKKPTKKPAAKKSAGKKK